MSASQQVARQLTIRYVSALVLVALTSGTAYLLLSRLIETQRADAAIINVSGRQRMLSQRTTMLALQVEAAPEGERRQELVEDLRSARDLFASSHRGLLEGNEELGLPGEPSAGLRALYFGPEDDVEARVSRHLELLDRFLAEEAMSDDLREYFGSNEPFVLLRSLNRVVGAYEAESGARITTLEGYERLVVGFTFLLLLLEGMLIFRPLVSRVQAQMTEIEEQQAALVQRDRDTSLLLDSLGEALFSVTPEGEVRAGWSAPVVEWFPHAEAGMAASQLLYADDEAAAEWFDVCLGELIDDALPEDLLIDQMPSDLVQGDRTLRFRYRVLRGEDDAVEGVLIVAQDVTAELEREREEQRARQQIEITSHLLRDREGFASFLTEAAGLMDRAQNPATDVELKRDLHTLKGNFAVYGFRQFSEQIHAIETLQAEGSSNVAEAIHAVVEAWKTENDRLQGMLGESTDASVVRIYTEEVDSIRYLVRNGVPTGDLLETIDAWHLEPVRPRLVRLGRQVLRLAEGLGKTVAVEVYDDAIRVDPDRVRRVWPVLIHAIRNAVDHGLESDDERAAIGKRGEGLVSLVARVENRDLVVEVKDDGRGIDVEKLRAKAEAAGIETDGTLSGLVFAQGLSSKDEVSDISGRGVGMAALQSVAQAEGAELSIASEPGLGSTFSIRFPHRRDSDSLRWSRGMILGGMAPVRMGGRRQDDPSELKSVA